MNDEWNDCTLANQRLATVQALITSAVMRRDRVALGRYVDEARQALQVLISSSTTETERPVAP